MEERGKQIRILLFILFCLSGVSLRAEMIGRMNLEEVLLQPEFLLREGSERGDRPEEGFAWGGSQAALGWQLNENLKSRFAVGDLALLNRPAYYTPRDQDQYAERWGVIEAYGLWQSPYGEFRMGLLPLNYSEEGSLREGELYFSRSLFFQNQAMALRDLGFQYFILHNGFFTSMTLHNGETGASVDQRMWVTAKWGWQDRDKFKVGFSGQTGSSEPESMRGSPSTLGHVDVTREAHWRWGSFFVKWQPSDFQTRFEIHRGEVEQNAVLQGRVLAWQTDLIWDWSKQGAVQLRYDQMDPDSLQSGDIQKVMTLGLSLANSTRTSQVFLLASKNIEEDQEVGNDELRLLWRLTPFSPDK